MAYPKQVKIGHLTYDLEWHSDLKNDNGVPVWGTWDTTNETIRVSKDHPSVSSEVNTVLHEIVHALMHQSGVEDMLEGGTGEAAVVALTNILHTTVRDNPGLFKKIIEDINSGS